MPVGRVAPVKAAHCDLSVRRVVSCVIFFGCRDWKERVAPDLLIRGIHLQSLDMFGSRVGFLKFRADVTREGKRVPGIVFMRGGAVAILVILSCEGERHVLFCRQPVRFAFSP